MDQPSGFDETTGAVILAHKRILRDETLMLRWIFGFCGEAHLSEPSTPWPRVPSTASLLHANPNIKHISFVSIKINKLEEQDEVIERFRIGFSIVDTQSLQNLLSGLPNQELDQSSRVIQSHHWIVRGPQEQKLGDNTFPFGDRRVVLLSDFEAQMKRELSGQHLALVFQDGKPERAILHRLNINLNPLFTIDTVNAAQHPLQLSYRYSLGEFLRGFQIPYEGLPTSGNYAHFILRALLMIVVSDVERQLSGMPIPDWAPALKTIAQAPPPPRPLNEEEIAAKLRREMRQRALDQHSREASHSEGTSSN
ncbi:hypothetical protein EDB81DRAFT_729892 [Dactylonectria macrodidyma]|uniref:Gfd2/YDR514C-like C-terminal domain-containing protein n=1 Tax=Dactylonectria macrodidyma TaxID=307937 RepID=A0A9P9E0B9_9HYPO|nr:hypothetical protein EDB81DRAFT_729892 [Dactylonectria macrodidyma]